MSAKVRTAVGALLLGLTAGGCSHAVSVTSGGTVQVALTEYRLNPSKIDVRSGSLTIQATNAGRLTHNLVVSRNGVTQATIRPLGPGQIGQVTVDLGPGTYLVGSTLHSDEALGLYGHLVVAH